MAIDRFSFGVQWVPIGTRRSANARQCGDLGRTAGWRGTGRAREEREMEEKEKRTMRAKWKYCLAARRLSFPPSRHLTLHPSADNPPTHRHPPCRFSFVLSPPGEFPRLICRFIRQSRSSSWILSLHHFTALVAGAKRIPVINKRRRIMFSWNMIDFFSCWVSELELQVYWIKLLSTVYFIVYQNVTIPLTKYTKSFIYVILIIIVIMIVVTVVKVCRILRYI